MPGPNEIILPDLLALNDSLINDDYPVIIEKVMRVARKACDADGCFFFSVSDNKYINLEYSRVNSLNVGISGTENMAFFSVGVSARRQKPQPQSPFRILRVEPRNHQFA